MIIGVPCETKTDESRVALTPAGVRELTSAGHTVLVEKGAGNGSAMPDADFVRTGAKIVEDADEVWGSADLVCKVKEPVADEFHRLGARSEQTLFTYLHLAASKECTDALVAAGNVAIAYETVRLEDNSLPLLAPMSEVAGRMAPLMGAHHLMRPGGGRGVLVSGVPGVRCARVVILGAGVAGFAASTIAVGMHSEVFVLDRNLDRLRMVDHHFRGALETIASSEHAIEEVCLEADIVIGAVLVVGAAPRTSCPTHWSNRCVTARSWSTSRWIRAGVSSRPVRRRIRTPPSRSMGRSSTAWPTCRARCRTRRPTRWPTRHCPTC